MKGLKLYEIDQCFTNVINLFEEGELSQESFESIMEQLDKEQSVKLDNIACLIKSINYETKAIKEEIEALKVRVKQKEKQIETLTAYIENSLRNSGKKSLETSRNKITLRKTSASINVLDENALIEWSEQNRYDILSYKAPTVSKTAIKELVKDGIEIPFIEFKQSEKVNIR